VALNELENVQCLELAVGDKVGSTEFFYTRASDLPTSSSLSSAFMQGTPGLDHVTVPLTTIDHFLSDRGIVGVDLVKMDTESTEPQVLRGMAETLGRDHPDLICEVLGAFGVEAELEEILKPLGYALFLLTPDGPEERARIVSHPRFLNYLFSRRAPEALARQTVDFASGG
jgi:FkbM family methyltransferase